MDFNPYDIADDDPVYLEELAKLRGGAKKQNDPGFVTGIKQGLGGFTSGVGQVAEDLGWKNNPIKSYGDEVQANNPSSAASQSWEGFKESPWQGVKEFAGQGIGSTLPSLATFLLPGGQGAAATGLARVGQVARGLPMQTALAAAPIYGQVREDQQHQGFDDIPAAAAAAIGGGIVESKLGIQRVLGKATDKPIQSFVGELASSPLKTGLKTWGRTGLEEGAEEIIQQPMQQLGAHRNPLTEESLRDTAWSGFGGLIGGLAMGGVGGAKMGLAHKRVDTFRQADLLNPETPLDLLDKQAQWNQAFIERDRGAEAGQQFYDQRQGEIDQYVESLVDPYRRQAFADQNRQIDLLADQERIAARAPSYLGQQSDYNPDDERVLNAIDRPNPADYRNWWENVPDPTNPEAYQQFWQHVTDGQESVRDVKRDALGTPLNQELPPGYVPVSFRSNGNATTQVAQESGQGASGVAGGSTGDTQDQSGVGRGGNELAAAPVLGSGTDQSVGDTRVGNGAGVNVTEPAQVVAQAQKANDAKAGTKSGTPLAAQGVKPGTKARGKAAMDFEVKLNKAIESGEISAEDQLVKDWHAGRKLARDAKEFEQALGDRLAGEALPPITPEQRLADEAAATGVESEITAPDTDPPAKPSTVAELKGYQSAIQQWLTSMLTPSSPKTPVGELQALVAVMGQKSEDALDQVVDQHRLRAAAAGLGVSHEHVRTQLISALKKIELAAEKAGFSTDTAYELLGLPSTFDIADVENVSAAEAAQAGLTIKGEDYTRSNKAQLSDDEANLGFDGSVTTDDGETVTIDGVSFSEFDEDDAGSAEDSVSNSDKISDLDVTPEEIDEAKAEWEDLDGTELPSKYHKRWAQAYVAREYGVINREEFGSEYADIVLEIESEKAAKVRKLDGQERSGVGEQTQDTARPEQTGSAEGSTDGVKQSRGVEGSTQASAIESKLKPLFFSNSRFSSRVVVVQSATALPQNLQSAIDGNTQAFVQGGKVYMIADNIAEGKELAVFLHEVGVHLGMNGLIGQENLNRLAMQIKRWATNNDGSVESELAKKALARVKSAQQGGVDMELGDVIEERVAYFVEEAVNAGINPTALDKASGPLKRWFRTMWAAVKTALRKFGLDRVHTLTAQNIVDLSYGAARLELEGTWHGTAADFRNFNHEYMGTGEANAGVGERTKNVGAFGWGTYVAQRPGIAKGYWEADMRRKGGQLRIEEKYNSLLGANVYSIMDGFDLVKRFNNKDAAEKFYRENKREGSLMRVDTAVHEDELLDWDKPLSEQPTVLEKLHNMGFEEAPSYAVAGKYKYHADSTGEQFYSILTSDRGSDKAASEYLDSIGIKGIKFLDSQSRGPVASSYSVAKNLLGSKFTVTVLDQNGSTIDTLEKTFDEATSGTKESAKQDADEYGKRMVQQLSTPQTRNLVIFNDKNIQRVVTQVGADRERIKFSKTAQAVKQYGGESGVQAWEDASGVASRAFKWFMSLHDLVGKYGDVLPSAKGWYDSVRATAAARNRIKEDAESIAARAGKLNKAVLKQLNEFISKSTYEQKWGYDATFDKLDGTKRDVKADPAMAALFRALPKDAQEIAKAVFAHGEKMKVEKFKIMKQLGLDKDTFLEQGSLTGPYAPLKRFGDYVAILKSKELRAAEQAGDTKKVEELKANPDHYVVSNFDTLGQAKKFARANEATFGWSDAFKGSINVEVGHRMKPETLQKVLAAVKAEDLPSNVKGQVETMVREMYLSAFDEHNARMSGLKRKNRAGYDADMIRSFLAHARAEAGFLSNMQHGGKTNELFYKLQQEAKNDDGKRTGQDVFNAIAQHYAANLDHKDTPIQDRVLAFTSIMQLATNPAYHIQNLMQPLMVSVPRLAADFNDYGGAWNALRQGYAISREMVKGNIFKLETEIDLSVVKNTKLREMLQTAADAGLLDVGMDEDLANFESTRTGYELVDNASNGMKKVVHKLRQMSRRVEATNRISAAVAAYNMSYGRNKDHAKATEYAISVLQDTQGDFSKTDAPLIIKRLPKFMVQYRKFQLMMAAHYVKAFNDAFRSEDAETRAVGRRTLLISLGHALGSAGVMGLPLMNVIGLIFKATGSDDEPRDLERTLREMFGDNANYLLRGPFWFMGLDAKLSQDKVFSILPYADWDLTSRKGGTNLLVGLTGPSGSNGLRMLEGFGKMAEGDYYKGLAGILPSGLANGVKAFQVANKGYTLKNGDVMVKPEDIETFQLLLDSIGMKSPEMRRMDWYKNQQWEVKQFYSDRSKEIQREYAEAFKEKDTAQLAELRQDWMDLQAGKDHLRYLFGDNHDELKRQPLSNLIKYPQTVANRERKLQRSVAE